MVVAWMFDLILPDNKAKSTIQHHHTWSIDEPLDVIVGVRALGWCGFLVDILAVVPYNMSTSAVCLTCHHVRLATSRCLMQAMNATVLPGDNRGEKETSTFHH